MRSRFSPSAPQRRSCSPDSPQRNRALRRMRLGARRSPMSAVGTLSELGRDMEQAASCGSRCCCGCPAPDGHSPGRCVMSLGGLARGRRSGGRTAERRRRELSSSERLMVLLADEDRCVYCGRRSEVPDRVVPFAQDEVDGRTSLMLACTRCNGENGGQDMLRLVLRAVLAPGRRRRSVGGVLS